MDKRINNTRIEEEKAVVEQMIRLYCWNFEQLLGRSFHDWCNKCSITVEQS